MKTGIYQIRNMNDGEIYVGSAKDFHVRWLKHKSDLRNCRHHSVYLQRAWSKHGEQNFVFERLLICRVEDLLIYEQILLDAMRPTYNICKLANNCTGVKHTAETKAKKSISSRMAWEARKARGETVSPLFIENGRKSAIGNNYRLGKCHSYETRAKLSASFKDRREEISSTAVAGWAKRRWNGLDKVSLETRAKLSAASMGHPVSAETRAKIGAANSHLSEERLAEMRSRRPTAETLEKLRSAARNRSAETRENIAAGQRGKTLSEETRAKIGLANRNRKATAETRAKMSAAQTAAHARRSFKDHK